MQRVDSPDSDSLFERSPVSHCSNWLKSLTRGSFPNFLVEFGPKRLRRTSATRLRTWRYIHSIGTRIERDINGLLACVMQSTSVEDISELDILEQRLWLIAGDPPTRPKQH